MLQARLLFITMSLVLVFETTSLFAENLINAEIFIDDPNIQEGDGTPLTLADGTTDPLSKALGLIDMTALAPGNHTLFIRFQDNSDSWSAPIGQTFTLTVNPSGSPLSGDQNLIEQAEAFIDQDPGEGNGIPLDIAADDTIDDILEKLGSVLDLNGLGIGIHTLHIRYLDSTALWSPTTSQSFYVPAVIHGPSLDSSSILISAAGQIDDGSLISLSADDGAFDSVVETVTLEQSVNATYHNFFMRFYDSQGVWSINRYTFPTFPGMPGDANGNYIVDLADVITTFQILTGESPPGASIRADLSGDDRIGMVDGLMLFRLLAGLECLWCSR